MSHTQVQLRGNDIPSLLVTRYSLLVTIVAQSTPSQQLLEKIVSLAKRRGFVFQSSEIYGGLNGCWDYGPLGVEMLRNLKDAWWRAMTQRGDIEGLDASILMHPRVWEASGHVQNFSDPMVDCRECKSRYRVDHLFAEMSEKEIESDCEIALQRSNTPRFYRKEQLAEVITGDDGTKRFASSRV